MGGRGNPWPRPLMEISPIPQTLSDQRGHLRQSSQGDQAVYVEDGHASRGAGACVASE